MFLNSTSLILLRHQVMAVWQVIRPLKWSMLIPMYSSNTSSADSTETALNEVSDTATLGQPTEIVDVDPIAEALAEEHRKLVEENIRVNNAHRDYVCKNYSPPSKCEKGIKIAEEKGGIWQFTYTVPTKLAAQKKQLTEESQRLNSES
jgi:hypothetical protein